MRSGAGDVDGFRVRKVQHGVNIVRRRVVIRGRVQGVFFRASCADEARSRGLRGWVRNRHDGAVEAAFEGAEPQVEAIVAWCRVGPPAARVDEVEVWNEPVEGTTGFAIAG